MSFIDRHTAEVATPRALKAALLAAPEVLLITAPARAAPTPAPGQPGAGSDYLPAAPDIFLAVCGDGAIFAFNGHVDLGTGIRTALGQLVAEELDVPLDRVQVLLGHTDLTPNQGPTIASMTLQVSARPLRQAAAQAREFLRARAAQRAEQQRPADTPTTYHALLGGEHIELTLDPDARLKPAAEHRLVGRSLPRVDIPAKAGGELCFVHDVRRPGMLHGRVLRPPYAGRDAGAFVGHSLVSVDHDSIASIPTARAVVIGDLVGVIAEREEQALLAARRLRLVWREPPPLPNFEDLEQALRSRPAERRVLVDQGAVARIFASAARVLEHTYVWPFQMHGSIGPSCAVADWQPDRLTVWSGTQNPHLLRIDLRRLLELDEDRIEVVRLEAAGCYGRNCADDVAADAALLSRACGRPVRVQLSRQQEHLWEPKGAAQLMDVRAALDRDGALLAYEFTTRYPSNDAPTLALLLTGRAAAEPRILQMGDRTAVPPYGYGAQRIVCEDLAPLVRASWLRGVSALPNCFAHESMIDELAARAGADPVEFRLRHVADVRAQDLMRRVAAVAGWQTHAAGSRGVAGADGLLRGRGFAYARYVHSAFPGVGAAWAAWAIDLSVEPTTGGVTIGHVVVGQDTGMMVNPDGVRHQIHGNVIQTLSRVLREEVMFDRNGVTSRDWGLYPIMSFCEVPSIEVVLMERQSEEPLGAGESAAVPGPAAVANALFDATGVRFRQAPFTPEKIRAAMLGPGSVPDPARGARPKARRPDQGRGTQPGTDSGGRRRPAGAAR
jgi:isoquinoline 1-oxidoreductase